MPIQGMFGFQLILSSMIFSNLILCLPVSLLIAMEIIVGRLLHTIGRHP
jgi:hypothetical protein